MPGAPIAATTSLRPPLTTISASVACGVPSPDVPWNQRQIPMPATGRDLEHVPSFLGRTEWSFAGRIPKPLYRNLLAGLRFSWHNQCEVSRFVGRHEQYAPARKSVRPSETDMKKLIAVLAAMVVAGAVSQALGQDWHGGTNWSPPLLHTNWPNLPPPNWTNFPAHSPPVAWTNTVPTAALTNRQGRIIPPVSPSVPSHVNSPQTPADVQTTIQQFQQSRQALMNQLEAATEEQRQAILGQLEQLREQMRDQLATLRQQAQDQAQQMQDRFGNNRGTLLNQGAPPTSGGGPGGGGRPRQ